VNEDADPAGPPAPSVARLEADYAAAWDEWESGGEQVAWEATVGDGLAAPS
jgi:hypothetical protein